MVGWHAGFDPPSPQGPTGAIGVPLFRKRGSAVAGDPGGWPLGSGRPEGSGAGGPSNGMEHGYSVQSCGFSNFELERIFPPKKTSNTSFIAY